MTAPISADTLASVRDARGHQRLYELNSDRYVLVSDLIDEIERLTARVDQLLTSNTEGVMEIRRLRAEVAATNPKGA